MFVPYRQLNVLSCNEVLMLGLDYVGYKRGGKAQLKTLHRRFKRHFGCLPKIVAKLWEMLQTTLLYEARLPWNCNSMKHFKYLMMSLFYLKAYPLEEQMASRFGVMEQTVRRWVQFFVEKLAAFKQEKVVWPEDNEWKTKFIISLDCVNFGINEPRHPTLHKDKHFFDRKGGKAGVRYEAALHLFSNRVVWFEGPTKASKGTDAEVYKSGLMAKVPDGCKVIADKIYKGCPKISLHNSLDQKHVRDFKGRSRARQESLFARMKSFEVLHRRFRHGVGKHKPFAFAV